MSDTINLKAALEAETAGDDKPAEVKVKDRNDEPYKDADGNPAVFYVLGEYSAKVKEYDKREEKRRKKALFAGQDESDAENWGRLATAITGWKLAIGGQDCPFSHENALTILSAAPWLRFQVALAMSSPASFSKGNSGS